MKRTLTVLLVVTTLADLLVFAPTGKKSIPFLPVVHAQDENSGCSLTSLKGPYAVEGQGTVVVQLPGLPAPPAPLAESSLANFNGAGAFSGHGTVSIGGAALNTTFTGTYTVNSDCTGNLTVNTNLGLTIQEAFVVIGGGRRFITTETDPLAVVERRVERLGD
jgi:hypothetical protein